MLASLSYMGDFRMKVPGGENRNKVENIVKHQLPWFRIMYSTLLTRLRFVHVNHNEESFTMHQDKRPATLALVAINLPQTLRLRLVQHFQRQPHLHPVFHKCKDMDPEELMPATSANIRKLRDNPETRKSFTRTTTVRKQMNGLILRDFGLQLFSSRHLRTLCVSKSSRSYPNPRGFNH